ncbi:MAG: DUF6599 family protein [Phycisphaerae bacterium]
MMNPPCTRAVGGGRRGRAGIALIAILCTECACDRSTPSSDGAEDARRPTSQRVLRAEAPAPPVRRGVDEQDDPRTPRYLPHSHDLVPWVKTKPVRVAEGRLGSLLSEREADRLSSFRITRGARCTYADGRGRDVTVIVIETESADDAYGVLSASCATGRGLNLGGLTRIEAGPPLTLHTWQGRSYVRAVCDGVAATDAEIRRLAARIVNDIPAENPPALLSGMPSQGAVPSALWLVRSVGALRPDVLERISVSDSAAVDRMLGLSGDVWLCIRAYVVDGADQPCIAWVAAYPQAPAARKAYDRIAAAIAAEPEWEHVSVLPPQQRFLIGTFTAEEESQAHVMPRVAMLLPS